MIILKNPSNIGMKRLLLLASVFVIFLVPSSLGLASNDACFDGGCHTSPDQRQINRSLYESNPHSILECVDCHVNSTSYTDFNHGQFIRTLNGSNVTGPLTTTYSSQNFALCYYCHEEAKVVGILSDYIPSELHVNAPIIVSSIGTNFINIDPAGYHNGSQGGGPDIPTNIHWNHLDDFGSVESGSRGKFDYNMSGNKTSYQSCPACHNVHGTNYPKMTKNDLAITYSYDLNGTFGYIGSEEYFSPGGDLYCGSGCHTSGTTFKYYGDEINLFEDCISCHAGGVPDDVNKTVFSHGVHVNINTTNGTGIVDNSDCWTCHYQRDMNRSNIYTCGGCHTGSGSQETPNAPKVRTHLPDKVNKTCEECHDFVKLDPGLNNDSTPYPNITAHYAQRPIVPTENYCDYCHGPNPSSPFPALNGTIPSFFHNSSNASFPENSTCRTCHTRTDVPADPLAMNNSSFHDLTSEYGDVSNGTIIVDCIICHVNHESQFANAPEPSHSTTAMVVGDCYMCHGTEIEGTYVQKLHDVRAKVKTNCILCHAINDNDVNVSLFGRHKDVNTTGGIDNITDDDCKTCHFGSRTGDLLMVPEAADSTNTYYCADCHTVAGRSPNKSSIKFTDKKHGEASCMDCHLADGIYHQDNPRGSVANSTYIARYATSNTNTTDCSDCHYAANLDDAPFNAPGGGTHLPGSFGGACASGGCHPGKTNMIETIHSVGSKNSSLKPIISVPILNTSTVNQGTSVSITATVNFTSSYAFVDGAQYRIMSGSTEILSWTPMSAADGNFNGVSDVATTTINTSILTPGIYTIQVRGMAGGPAQNISMRYYPINGDASAINSTTLTVLPKIGYINGTITSDGQPISGAIVSTMGTSSNTDIGGNYSLAIPVGTYNVTASKRPEYYDNTTSGVIVTPGNTTNIDFILTLKPIGTISGTVVDAQP